MKIDKIIRRGAPSRVLGCQRPGLMKLLEKSYDMCVEMTDSEAIFLEKAIDSEKDDDLRDALQELDDFLCGF